MTIAYRASGAAAPFSAATSVSVPRASVTALDFLCITFAVESQAAGSGPWVLPNTGQFANNVVGPSTGWLLAGFQAPSATGVGLEVWVAINGGTGPAIAELVSSYTGVAVMSAWSGVYYTTGRISNGALRTSAFQQWTGNAPQAPAVTAFVNELVIACGSMLMTTPGFGTPTGNGNETSYTNRVDVERSGFGTGETTQADALGVANGDTGAITFPGNAASGTSHGATATLAVRPLGATPVGSLTPFINFSYPLT
jgi:hypothetical protein